MSADAGVNSFAIGSSTATYFLVNSTGNVGIGTTTPTSLLSVHGTSFIGSGTSATSTFNSNLDVLGQLKVGTGSIYLNGSATSTFSHGIQTSALNITSSSATSTFANGISLSGGCFAVNGTCVGGLAFSNTLANGGTATTTFYSGGIVFSDGTKLTQYGEALRRCNVRDGRPIQIIADSLSSRRYE